nr:DUF1824 family protein [Neosynechococcus sphagnicola]
MLAAYSCNQNTPINSSQEKIQVRQALLAVIGEFDYQTLGICADTMTEAFQALQSYLQGFGLAFGAETQLESLPATTGGVYLKFNTQRQSFYSDTYTGSYRGVLVTCQSHDPQRSGATYGHFPLDLFCDSWEA